MLLRKKDLINLPVETRSGQALGRISDFELNPLTQQIERYYVKSGRQLISLFPGELIIHYTQVLSVTSEKMVVDDNARAKAVSANRSIAQGQTAPATGP